MTKQVLIINITRMGDVIQMGTLLARLRHECPGVAVDLVVDRKFAPAAALLTGLRHVIVYDFHQLIDVARTMTSDVVRLYLEIAEWARPLLGVKYDRVINLTFNRRSGFLASYVGARDVRGISSGSDGGMTITNPWMAYFTDLHHHRRFNRFNLVDLYAMGGSGVGPFAALSVNVPESDKEWAAGRLRANAATVHRWVAVQIGASDSMKAWRPEYFGRTMAHLARQRSIGYLLIGGPQEADVIEAALRSFRAAGGSAPLCNVVGQTSLAQLAALLAQCGLLLTNDTGPMHVAVGVGTPVIDLSVGHVDFCETGPYGPGHWVIQPDLACAPCGFDQVCAHHACKDRVVPEQVSELCAHVLGEGRFPALATGVRIYESAVDRDGLGSFILRAGHEDPASRWYGEFWRTYWYETFTGFPSARAGPTGPSPHHDEVVDELRQLLPVAQRLVAIAERLVRLCRQKPLPVTALQEGQRALQKERRQVFTIGSGSPAIGPLLIALLRETANDDLPGLLAQAQHHAKTYRSLSSRLEQVQQRIVACQTDRPQKELPVLQSAKAA